MCVCVCVCVCVVRGRLRLLLSPVRCIRTCTTSIHVQARNSWLLCPRLSRLHETICSTTSLAFSSPIHVLALIALTAATAHKHTQQNLELHNTITHPAASAPPKQSERMGANWTFCGQSSLCDGVITKIAGLYPPRYSSVMLYHQSTTGSLTLFVDQ